MRKQFLLSVDLLRNETGENGEEILYNWSARLKKSLKVMLNLNKITAEALYTFLSGSLYVSFLHPDFDPEPGLNTFKKMLMQHLNQGA